MSRVMMRFAGAAALALFAAACDQTPVDLPVETELVLGTEAVTLHVGQSTAVSAVVVDQSGVALRNAEVRWAISNATVAEVDDWGEVYAVAEGTADIIATYGSLSATIPVTVLREDREFIQKVEFIEESGSYHRTRNNIELGLRLFSGHGFMQNCNSWMVQPVSAASSNPAVASVGANPAIGDCSLQVTLHQAGTATISLTVNGASASYELTVIDGDLDLQWVANLPTTAAAGDTVTVSALVTNEKGEPVEGRAVFFSPGATFVGTLMTTEAVTGANGIASVRWAIPTSLRYLGTGNRSVIASIEGVNGQRFTTGAHTVNVTAGKAASLAYFRYDDALDRYVPIAGTSVTLETNTITEIVVASYDKHGNLISSVGSTASRTIGGTVTANFIGAVNLSDYQLINRAAYRLNVSSTTEQTADLEVKVVWDAGTSDEIELIKTLSFKFVDPS